ncbi:pectinesterase family protein [Flavobacterium sp. RHBU_3]|uniref:pectinesterase family protein n=1 Tax=Flavobacterium sp. RHBU_3 TaxID=3391184 RepID=UPI00398476DD
MKTKIQMLFLALVSCIPVLLKAQTTDVWDFGAAQLDAATYNNVLSESVINSWYDVSVTPGTSGLVLPSAFTAGALSWVGGTNDRLRTTNTNLTRYDANIASVTDYTGRIYCNAIPSTTNGLPATRYLSLVLNEDDEVTIIARGDTAGSLSFVYESDPTMQTDNVPTTSTSATVTEVHFVAKYAGTYRIFDQTAKASFYRVYRTPATYVNVTGAIDVSMAWGLPDGYSVVFTNAAGKSWPAVMNTDGTYSVTIPVGYTYELSLADASGFIISSGDTLDTTGITTPDYTHDIALLSVNLYSLSGAVTGLGTDISAMQLAFAPDPSVSTAYVPMPIVDTTAETYSVQLEPDIEYTISATGVNDYEILQNTITLTATGSTFDIAFTPKSVYPVTISTSGLTTMQQESLQLTFTNLNEAGYSYTFGPQDAIELRDGVYAVTASGLNDYPIELGLASNLAVNGAAVSKTLEFVPVTVWSFNDQAISTTTSASYKGMLFTGQVITVTSSGHLAAKSGATIQVPVNPGEKVSVSYYYSANFSIEGGESIITASNTTSVIENAEYTYMGDAAGFVTITVGGEATATSYFTEIKTSPVTAYVAEITVGTDKDYPTINQALKAIASMERGATDRVTVVIDPGNYEEMLVINQPNITLKNASSSPNTNLINKGVDITEGAVRITSYYGHGYNYFSMANNQKWNEDVLNVNTENGYTSYQNTGAGTTNGSYWNATVVISAAGFIAENIIFENSFNQYISLKESQDTVQEWSQGSPGARPTTYGDTSVQLRTMVERAAAIAITNNTDKVVLYKCRVVGRQDSFYGGVGARVAVYKGDMMGAVDYIFGGMDVVFYKSNLTMNVCDLSNDQAYITAAQQSSGRGYLMYECTVTTAIPQVETASVYRAKPGYFGRPWQATTSEVVFYNTTIETSDYPGSEGSSLIVPAGWNSTLGGTSAGMYEFGTIEVSGVNNTPSRASWATSLTTPVLNDGTEISTFNFTKGNDDWDPFPALIENDLSTGNVTPVSGLHIYAYKSNVAINNVKSNTNVQVYSITGALIKTFKTAEDTTFTLNPGMWIVVATSGEGQKSVKLITF